MGRLVGGPRGLAVPALLAPSCSKPSMRTPAPIFLLASRLGPLPHLRSGSSACLALNRP